MLLRVVAQNLKPVKLFSQQPPTFVWFRDRRSVAQQCWIGVCTALPTLLGPRTLITHGFSKTYGFYSSHNALQDPNLLGVANTHATAPNIVGATMLGVVEPVCTQPYITEEKINLQTLKVEKFLLHLPDKYSEQA